MANGNLLFQFVVLICLPYRNPLVGVEWQDIRGLELGRDPFLNCFDSPVKASRLADARTYEEESAISCGRFSLRYDCYFLIFDPSQSEFLSMFREVKRRTRPMGVFGNRGSKERILYAVFFHLNSKGQEIPSLPFTQNA